jgi:Asp-tRNA(Asn)/Glu-tRNA(Gln) amidotransferase A subunit family amidase
MQFDNNNEISLQRTLIPPYPDATAISLAVGSGQATASAIAESFLARIAEHEPHVQAFASFSADRVRQQAAQSTGGPLAGLTVGVKDMFDTVDYPTEYFSPLYQGHRPARDAHVVTLLRQAGAVVMGKTHTTEFAYMHTGPTRNPHDLRCTPGSSSAGSAAGMAAGFFPVALGTQTAGSLIKPAAFCGVHAFKPSFGLVSLEGIKPLAPSFDTVGWYGRSVRDLALLGRVLIPGLPSAPTVRSSLHLGFCRTSRWDSVSPDVREAARQAMARLRDAGHRISEVVLPPLFDTVFTDHALINDCEGARSLAKEYATDTSRISASTREMIEQGRAIAWAAEAEAKARLAKQAPVLADIIGEYDALLCVSCPTVALAGLGSTGPSDLIKLWTAFGLPQVNLPLDRAAGELPVGLQVIGALRDDAQLLAAAAALARDLTWVRP